MRRIFKFRHESQLAYHWRWWLADVTAGVASGFILALMLVMFI